MRQIGRNRGGTSHPKIIQLDSRGQALLPMKNQLVPTIQQQQRNNMNQGRLYNNGGGMMNGYPVMIGNSQQQIQEFNKANSEYTQSYRSILNQGSNPFTPVLSGSGLFFHGLSLSIGTVTSLQDTQVSFSINNRQLLVDVSALILIPNYAQGMLYYPVPQPLTGKDTFKINFLKNDAGTITMYFNFIYKPAL
jgi:hypothetical protein